MKNPILRALRSACNKVSRNQFEKDLANLRKKYKLPTVKPKD